MGNWVSDEERIRKDGVMSDDKNICKHEIRKE